MKETPLSSCEKAFVLEAVNHRQRLDGRGAYDYREWEIIFGSDWGCCQVTLGKTRVLAQVSCEVREPKAVRPHEGLLFVNVELSPMGAPHFEPGRQSDLGVELSRLLERCIKDSKCVDLESLCIVAEEKVWAIRLDLHVLNHDGNLADCASVSGLAALSHFRRPDVTLSGKEVIIHPVEEQDPVPLSIHHIPVCVTFAFFDDGKHVLLDPTVLEERVMEGKLVLGMNAYHEICTLHLSGQMLVVKEQVLRCAHIAAARAGELVQNIKQSLERDTEARGSGKDVGFTEAVKTERITAAQKEASLYNLGGVRDTAEELVRSVEADIADSLDKDGRERVIAQDSRTADLIPQGLQIGEGGENLWMRDTESETSEESEVEMIQELTAEEKLKQIKVEEIELSEGSEEEEDTTMLTADDLGFVRKKPSEEMNVTERSWYPSSW